MLAAVVEKAKVVKDEAVEKTRDEDGGVAVVDGDWAHDPAGACYAGGVKLEMAQLQST